jgi:hypothetical protein
MPVVDDRAFTYPSKSCGWPPISTGAGDEDLGRPLAHRDQLFDLELLQDVVVHPVDVAGDQAGVRLRHPGDRVAGGVVDDLDLVDRLVRLAVAQDGDVEHVYLTAMPHLAATFNAKCLKSV